jgi:hypothetical protein
VVSGLVVSIGGLTESVVRAATDATVAWAISAIKLKLRAPVVRLGRTLVAMFEVCACVCVVRVFVCVSTLAHSQEELDNLPTF